MLFQILASSILLNFAFCQLPVDKCSPVMCEIYCLYGFKINADGCPYCACKMSPCDNEAEPLANYFCGRGPNRKECPENYRCTISPVDAYAVCCPQSQPIVKAGKCPKQTGVGICIARCNDDSNCPNNQKCCGGCPRICMNPV